MPRTRSPRRLILDRLERNSNCRQESIRRLDEIMQIYTQGETERPGEYITLMAQVKVLIDLEIKVTGVYQTFMDVAKI